MTYAIRVQAPMTRNGNSRFGYVITSHGDPFEAFVIDTAGNGTTAAYDGVEMLKASDAQRPPAHNRFAHLQQPYTNTGHPIRITASQWREFVKLAGEKGALVHV